MKEKIEPYRVLFPIGTLFALAGVLLWILFLSGVSSVYPGTAHAGTMIGGFLFAFITGFLMTAIPKMTGASSAHPIEIIAALGAVLATGVAALASGSVYYSAVLFVGFVLLILFGIRRLLGRRKPVPIFFICVGSGLAAGLVGALLMTIGSWTGSVDLGRWGRLLLFQIMVLSFVIGIGCRLVPVLSGEDPVDHSRAGWKARFEFLAAVAVLWISIFFEMHDNFVGALLLRAVAASWIALRYWKLFAWSRMRSSLGVLVKVSAVFVLAGLWMAFAQPGFSLHWMHLTYIGGFGLMTLTVASRVTLAHGGFDLAFEKKSKALRAMGVLLLLAGVTRVAAPFIPNGYFVHLKYAAILWLAGVIVWGSVFVRKMIFPKRPQDCQR